MPISKDTKRKADNKLSQKRGHLVVQRNDFIQKSRHQLSLQEQKIVLYLISHIKPDDVDFTEQVFSIADFCRFCGMDEKNGKNYSDIKNALGKLRSRYVWVTLEDGSETTLGWINKATINKNSGLIRLRLDEDLKPFLLLLTEHYTLYEMRYTLAMKSRYSIRLYELLRSYAYKKSVVFGIDELKRLLDAENHALNGHFKAKVLDVAAREINEYTDISIEYGFQKEGRRFSHVWFNIYHKSTLDRFIAGDKTDRDIDRKNKSQSVMIPDSVADIMLNQMRLQPMPGEVTLFPG